MELDSPRFCRRQERQRCPRRHADFLERQQAEFRTRRRRWRRCCDRRSICFANIDTSGSLPAPRTLASASERRVRAAGCAAKRSKGHVRTCNKKKERKRTRLKKAGVLRAFAAFPIKCASSLNHLFTFKRWCRTTQLRQLQKHAKRKSYAPQNSETLRVEVSSARQCSDVDFISAVPRWNNTQIV